MDFILDLVNLIDFLYFNIKNTILINKKYKQSKIKKKCKNLSTFYIII